MDALSDEVLFTIRSVPYRLPDVVHAARRWGDLARLEEALRHGLACVAHATQEDSLPTDAEIEAAGAEFRYERDLITAEEMQAWLERWRLSVDAWTAYLERRLLRRRWAADAPDLFTRYPVSPAHLADALHVEGICSGDYGRVAHKLAGRLAAREWARDEGRLHVRDVAGDDPALSQLDAAVDLLRERAVSAATIRAEVAARHLDWVRVHFESLTFADLARAREAILCVRDDGQTLAHVAAESRTVLHRGRVYLEDVDPSWRDHLLGALAGDVVGPLAGDQGFAVLLVVDKVLPADEDPDVRARAGGALLERALEHEIAHRVKWHHRL